LLSDKFTDIDVFMPWDLLYRAKVASGGDWQIRILGKSDYVTSVAGLRIPTHGRLDETKDSQAVIVASGIGIEEVLVDRAFLDSLHFDASEQLIGSMCAGAMILAEKGLLKGCQATTYPTYFARLARYEGVEPVERGFVPVGNVATAGGCLAAQSLCGWLIEKLAGSKLRDAVLASIMPVGEGCKAFAGWGDAKAAAKAEAEAALKRESETAQA
jgi:transcriptional regulator GlxA family with amidase domain